MQKLFYNTKNHTKKLCDFLFDLIFPIECLNCGKEKEWLCQQCFSQIKINQESNCPNCGRKTYAGQYCIYCQDDFALKGIFIAGSYHDKNLKLAKKNLKYDLIKDLGIDLGKFLNIYWQNLEKNFLNKKPSQTIINSHLPHKLLQNPQNIIVIPIPLHPIRFRFRGFNQSEIIAQKFVQTNNLKIETNKLIRRKNTKAQAKLNKNKRLQNIQNCFAWQGEAIKAKVILIDDVTSTGATLNEAAKIILDNGAQEVWGLVLAKN